MMIAFIVIMGGLHSPLSKYLIDELCHLQNKEEKFSRFKTNIELLGRTGPVTTTEKGL